MIDGYCSNFFLFFFFLTIRSTACFKQATLKQSVIPGIYSSTDRLKQQVNIIFGFSCSRFLVNVDRSVSQIN